MTRQTPASAIAIMLAVGFAYSGFASFRLLDELFQRPPMHGRDATVDAYLAPVNLSSAAELRQAVRCVWPSVADIDVVGDGALARPQVQQIYFVSGYLLYPRSVFSRQPPLAAHQIIAGSSPHSHVVSHKVSDLLTLVERR